MPKPNCVCATCGKTTYRSPILIKRAKHGVYCSWECFQCAPKTQKPDARRKARKLRAAGWSVNKIAAELSVAKSSVSLWVRDMPRPENLIPKPKPKPKPQPKPRVRKLYVMDSQGYVMVPKPKDYNNTAYCNGRYVYLHRLVVERSFRRYLSSNEVVHHINGDKQDNRLCNLEVTTAAAHASAHAKQYWKKVPSGEFRCPVCSTCFTRSLKFTHVGEAAKTKFTCCSRRCAGRMSAYIKHRGYTNAIRRRVERSLICTFTSE